jgi:hypothetical protein
LRRRYSDAGDVAAVDLLRRALPALKIRVVNVVDLMTLQPKEQHPHGLSDRDFDSLFTREKPVIFAYHGYPLRRASSPSDLMSVAIAMQLGQRDLLVQEFHDGPLAMVQAVADTGRLIALHANLRVLVSRRVFP